MKDFIVADRSAERVLGARPTSPVHREGKNRPFVGRDLTADRAFGDALSNSRSRLTAFARRLARDGEAAEDLVQETLLRAWAARDRFERGTNFKAWTNRILRNLFLSQRRRARFQGEYDEARAERRLAQPETQTGIIALNETAKLLDRLPAAQQQALRMVVIEHLSYEEAARRTGIAIGTMKSRVSRARDALKALMSGELRSTLRERVEGEEAPSNRSSAIQRPGKADFRGAWAAAKAAGRPYLIGQRHGNSEALRGRRREPGQPPRRADEWEEAPVIHEASRDGAAPVTIWRQT